MEEMLTWVGFLSKNIVTGPRYLGYSILKELPKAIFENLENEKILENDGCGIRYRTQYSVLYLLKHHPEGLSKTEISELTSLPITTARDAVTELIRIKKVKRVKESVKTGHSRPISKWKLLGEGELDNYNFDDYLKYVWSSWAEGSEDKEDKFHLINGALHQFPEYIKEEMSKLGILQEDESVSIEATVKYALGESALSMKEITEKTGISNSMLHYSMPRLKREGKVKYYRKYVTFRELKGDRKKFNEYKEKNKKYELISK